jgi:hypothetical protein
MINQPSPNSSNYDDWLIDELANQPADALAPAAAAHRRSLINRASLYQLQTFLEDENMTRKRNIIISEGDIFFDGVVGVVIEVSDSERELVEQRISSLYFAQIDDSTQPAPAYWSYDDWLIDELTKQPAAQSAADHAAAAARRAVLINRASLYQLSNFLVDQDATRFSNTLDWSEEEDVKDPIIMEAWDSDIELAEQRFTAKLDALYAAQTKKRATQRAQRQ